MPTFVLDAPQTTEVEITVIKIDLLEVDPLLDRGRVSYHSGILDADGNFVMLDKNRIAVTGSEYTKLVDRAEEIRASQDITVYNAIAVALYEFVAAFEGVTGTVEE